MGVYSIYIGSPASEATPDPERIIFNRSLMNIVRQAEGQHLVYLKR